MFSEKFPVVLAYVQNNKNNNIIIIVPNGEPQNLRFGSSNSTSITILWDEVLCTERNTEITGYFVNYYPLIYSDILKNATVLERAFAANGLIPDTTYVFNVSAISDHGHGPTATMTQRTALFEGM